jgi:hypothetical protein
MSSIARLIDSVASGRPPTWVAGIVRKADVDSLGARASARLTTMTAAIGSRRRDALRLVRLGLLLAAVGSLGLAAIALVYPGRVQIAGLLPVRDPSVWRPALMAMTFGVLAGRGRWTARIAVVLVLMTLLPIARYRTALTRAVVEHHPLLTSRNCVQGVQAAERAAGRPVPGVYVYLPEHTYLHPYFFYYRTLGWDRHDGLEDDQLTSLLDTPGLQRPVMMPRDRFLTARAAHDDPAAPPRSFVQVNDIVILMPGPYARCGY